MLGSILGCVLLAINSTVNGLDCWGRHPGGGISAILYAIVSIGGFVSLGIGFAWLVRFRSTLESFRYWFLFLFMVLGNVVGLVTRGPHIFTSSHYQGVFNDVAFFFATLTSLTVNWIMSSKLNP